VTSTHCGRGEAPPTKLTPTHRVALCPVCGERFLEPRRGPGGNALGAVARLKGRINAHVAERHDG
jgi:hypothetical protein